jgi:DHA3 family macrolide efflux protein-like MFS transporter
MTAPPSTTKPQAILKHRPFRTLWLAQFVSIFGDFLALFGVISLITFRMHGTAVQVTAVTIAYILPLALISPVAGVFVDHWNVKRLMIASDLIRAALILLLVFVRDVTQICVIFAALSTVSSFFAPAQSVTIRTIVPQEGLLAANAMLTQAFYVVRLFSPFAAGALIGWLGEKVCFYLDTASFVFSAGMISTLTIMRPRAQTEKTLESLSRDFVEGNRFIFTHAGLAFVFLAMGVAMLVLSAFSPLISIYIRDSLHAGPFLFGAISSMVGIGLIAGAQVLARVHRPSSRTQVVLGGMFALGAGAALLGAFHNTPMAALSTFTMGFAISFVLIPAQTLSQQETPPGLMGRVSSTFMSLISLAQVLGLLLSGYLAQRLGIRALFLSCAGVLAVVSAAGYVWMRGRREAGTGARAGGQAEVTVRSPAGG